MVSLLFLFRARNLASRRLDDFVGRDAGRTALEIIDGFHAFDHFAEHCVLAIKVRRRGKRDKELRAACISSGMRHA